ncbi:Exportin-4 [Bienertia sinuspersici]
MATNSTSSLHYPTLNFSISYFQLQPQLYHHHHLNNPTIKPISLSFSPRPRRRRRHRNPIKRNKNSSQSQFSSPDSNKLQFILDVDQLKTKTPLGLLESKFNQFVSSGIEAYDDIRSLIIVEPVTNRIVVSCSDSTIRFVGGVAIWGFVGVVMIRVLVRLGLGFSGRSANGGVEVVKRRDRSLGGREVVVERRVVKGGERMNESNLEAMPRNSIRKEVKKLPNWWPVVGPRPIVEVNREEYRREADKLVQAITDDKLRGKDVSEEDILELHRICRMSGIQLSFGTENARDSFYRLAVYNVINTCCRAGNPSVQIDGEDACLFIAGLAYDVDLSNHRAATIVSAAVAAQTRLWFLQAWALEMQAKHSEAIEQLRKICLIHQIFPPEPSSPEMEMVARGLQKNLKLEQREFLLTNLISVCGEQGARSAGEALGLV